MICRQCKEYFKSKDRRVKFCSDFCHGLHRGGNNYDVSRSRKLRAEYLRHRMLVAEIENDLLLVNLRHRMLVAEIENDLLLVNQKIKRLKRGLHP